MAAEFWSLGPADRSWGFDGEAIDLISSHTDAMLDPHADLSEAASELTKAFLSAAEEDGESILADPAL